MEIRTGNWRADSGFRPRSSVPAATGLNPQSWGFSPRGALRRAGLSAQLQRNVSGASDQFRSQQVSRHYRPSALRDVLRYHRVDRAKVKPVPALACADSGPRTLRPGTQAPLVLCRRPRVQAVSRRDVRRRLKALAVLRTTRTHGRKTRGMNRSARVPAAR
jgi:hypothetical protein